MESKKTYRIIKRNVTEILTEAPKTVDYTGVEDAVLEYRSSDPDPDNWAVCYCDQGKLWYHVDGMIDLDEQYIDWEHPDEVELDD